jgi:hypothetical protein
MENNNEIRKENFRWPRIGSVANRSANDGKINSRFTYTATSWPSMMVHVEEILLRGNAVRMVNVAGLFKITELVVS